jgi:uncharacterized protein YegL
MSSTPSVEPPGGAIARRPLHFIWICDCSGSMQGEKIQSLNFAIRDAIPAMQEVAGKNTRAMVFVRALKFSSGAQWINSDPVPVEQFMWYDLSADGVTDMGKALTLVAEEMKPEKLGTRGLPPVLVLISDGQPTDDYEEGITKLMKQPWGKKAVRIAIAIGADADEQSLQKFMGNTEVKPLRANNPDALVNLIRWTSTTVLTSASQPIGRGQTGPIPAPPPESPGDDVW